jgi:hypothetical protein
VGVFQLRFDGEEQGECKIPVKKKGFITKGWSWSKELAQFSVIGGTFSKKVIRWEGRKENLIWVKRSLLSPPALSTLLGQKLQRRLTGVGNYWEGKGEAKKGDIPFQMQFFSI